MTRRGHLLGGFPGFCKAFVGARALAKVSGFGSFAVVLVFSAQLIWTPCEREESYVQQLGFCSYESTVLRLSNLHELRGFGVSGSEMSWVRELRRFRSESRGPARRSNRGLFGEPFKKATPETLNPATRTRRSSITDPAVPAMANLCTNARPCHGSSGDCSDLCVFPSRTTRASL